MANFDVNDSTGGEVATESRPLIVALAWLVVGAPLLWGVAQTIRKALALFR